MVALSFEIEHSIDYVLKHFRACYCSLLSYMAHKANGDFKLFGFSHKPACTLAYLRYASRCRSQVFCKNRLNRINDHKARRGILNPVLDSFQVHLRKD